MSQSSRGKSPTLTYEQREKKRAKIMQNKTMMGNKTELQKAKNRWGALKKKFSKDPIVNDDLHMMQTIFGANEAVKKLSPEHLREWLSFRFKFLREELEEGERALKSGNSEEITDSLFDLLVVVTGTLDSLEIDFSKGWYEVLRANMAKEVGIKPERPNPLGLPDLVKPEGWEPPSHRDNHGLLTKAFPPKSACEV